MSMNDIVRLKVLSDILDNMSDEDRRTYLIMSSQKEDSERLRQNINIQDEKLNELIQRTSWTKSFLSDVGANVVTNAAFLLISKLFK